jgi:hypothetical protein
MPRPSRDEATKMRTRVAAKMSLLSLFSGMCLLYYFFLSNLLTFFFCIKMKLNIS